MADVDSHATQRGLAPDIPAELRAAGFDDVAEIGHGGFGVVYRCVQPMLDQGKKGSIINVCSTYGLNGPDQRIYVKDGQRLAFKPVYYPVTKAGVIGFTKYLAAYYAGTSIRVNGLTPGGVFNNHED